MTIKKQNNKNKILGGGKPNLRSKFWVKEFYFYCFVFLLVAYFLLLTTPILAQVKLETGLPGHSTVPTETALPSYINYLFIFGLSLITILALGKMIVGGISYILAAGNVVKVEDAKDEIFQALIGLGVLLVSYLLLYTINPDLVNLRNPNLTPTQFQGVSQRNPIGENITPVNKTNPAGNCKGRVEIMGESPVCLGTDAETRQKIGWGDGPTCKAAGGQILVLGTGLYCSKPFK